MDSSADFDHRISGRWRGRTPRIPGHTDTGKRIEMIGGNTMKMGKAIVILIVIIGLLGLTVGAASAQNAPKVPPEVDVSLDLPELDGSGMGPDAQSAQIKDSLPKDKLDFEFGKGLSLKSEVIHRQNEMIASPVRVVKPLPASDIDPFDDSLESVPYAAMGNIQYELSQKTAITPYVFGGIGPAHPHYDDETLSVTQGVRESGWRLAYQLGAGFGYSFADYLSIGLSYRHFSIDDLDSLDYQGVFPREEYRADYFRLSLRYHR